MAAVRVRLDRAPAHKLHPLEGFGAQFNANIFRPASMFPAATAAKEGQPRALTPGQLNELRATVKNLKPGHSRIFIHRELVAGPQPPAKELEALLQSVRLAQHGGANVNLTFWGQGTYAGKARLKGLKWPEPGLLDWPRQKEQQGKFKWPDELRQGQVSAPAELMRRFANIIKLARAEGACITHVTIQNEPNGVGTDIAVKGIPRLSMRMYEWLYRLLDKELRKLDDPLSQAPTLRDAIKLVGGDLVLEGNSGQNAWLAYMRANMDVPRPQFPRVLDGYSIHVYWDPGDELAGFPRKLEKRLENLPKILRELGIDRPLYVTEYGVKKQGASRPEPGGRGSGQSIEFSAEVAFQHAWFNALAPQCGCVGFAKWVLYRTDVPAHFGEWGMIDAPNAPSPRTAFGRSPTYRVTRLFNHLVEPGWKAAGLGRDASRTVLASKFSNGNQESVAILNRGTDARQVVVEGVKPRTPYFVAVWNRDGTGGPAELLAAPITSTAAREATVDVPKNGVVAISTRPLRL